MTREEGHWITTPRVAQAFDWIDFGNEEKPYDITCSECGYQYTTTNKMITIRVCPKCGADMRTKAESEVVENGD